MRGGGGCDPNCITGVAMGYSHAHTFGVCRYLRSRRPSYLVPLVPLSFFMAYQLDISFGSQIKRGVGECQRAWVTSLAASAHLILHGSAEAVLFCSLRVSAPH